MGLNRRTFLKQTGLNLLILGATETGLLDQILGIKTYLQSLAQPTPRKLALLVGINQYNQGQSLKGCLTDVELQRELLIYRFGFNPKDILILTDQQATRENIETAFLEHLTGQVKGDDIVVFHFSGYGSQVTVPQSAKNSLETPAVRVENSLVPADGIFLTKDIPIVNDILEETLFWLMRSLPTNKQTLILDTSYIREDQTFQGNLRIRSCPGSNIRDCSPEELAFQEQLFLKLNINIKTFNRLKNSLPGVILKAVGDNQIATEGQWNGLNVGLFTYALTQYLWQMTAPTTIQISLARTTETIGYWRGSLQTPLAITGNQKSFLSYYNLPDNLLGSEAIIKSVEADRKTVEIKLTGLPLSVLINYSANSRFNVLNQEHIILELIAIQGLKAKAKLITASEDQPNLKPGQLLQESWRVIPKNLGLNIGLDSSLERIERVDATSAFANLNLVESVITKTADTADCILAKIIPNSADNLTDHAGYQLLLPGGCPIPNTQGKANEAVKVAVNRLTPQLKKILATKLWRLTLNEGSSRLKVKVTLAKGTKGNYQPFLERTTQVFLPNNINYNLSIPQSQANPEASFLPNLELGNQIEYTLENDGETSLYWLLLGLDPNRNPLTFYTAQDTPILPKEVLTIPSAVAPLNWMLSGATGLVETLVIFSTSPFTETRKLITENIDSQSNIPQILSLENILEITQALLQDLHQNAPNFPADVYALDVNHWASLSFVYQLGIVRELIPNG